MTTRQALSIAAVLGIAAIVSPLVLAADEPAGSAARPVVAIRVDSIIHPAALEYIVDGIVAAEAQNAQALIIELDTPGGLMDTTFDITAAMLASDVPIVVFVSPRGAHAASAGFFLLLAADVAAMAPETNTGAAHPVALGENLTGDVRKKAEEDSAARIRSLAERKGRDTALAQSAVIESKSFTATEALEKKLIDLIADDLGDLLEGLDGRTVTKNAVDHVLRTRDVQPTELPMTPFQKVRSILVHPDVAVLLMSLGTLALVVELWTPGAVVPGVVGAICILLGLYGASVLPVSYAGIALLILSAILFVLEIKVAGLGVLGAGGVVSLVLGLLLLFKSTDPAVRVSLELIVGLAVVAAALVAFLAFMVVRSHRRTRVATGREGMLNERGLARTDLTPRGKVTVRGEIWDAISEAPITAGQPIEVVEVDGLLLRVQPAAGR